MCGDESQTRTTPKRCRVAGEWHRPPGKTVGLVFDGGFDRAGHAGDEVAELSRVDGDDGADVALVRSVLTGHP
jgi:hypothetical protein